MERPEIERTSAFNFTRSAVHLERAESLIPGGAHTYSRGADQYPAGMAPFIVSGSGCLVKDLDGNELVEYGMGLRAVTLGHGYAPVEERVIEQLKKGVNFARPHVMEAEVAEALLEVLPSGEMVKFGVNGSDVTSGAIRLARAYTGRDLVARCGDQPFFSTDDWFIGTTQMSAGIPTAISALTLLFPFNDLPAIEQLFQRHPNQIAAVILEAETTTPPHPQFFPGLRKLCDQYGVVLILDEIITGFRWNIGGAQAVYGIEPDLATFGKGIGNGFPGSALVGKREIMRLGGYVDDADRVFLLSQTYGASPLMLAAMHATIDDYQANGHAERLNEIGAELRTRLTTIILSTGLQDHVQILGRSCNLVYATNDEDLKPSQGYRTLLLQELLRHGVVCPSLVVSTAHDEAALQRTEAAFAAAMKTYAAALSDGLGQYLIGRPVRPAFRSRG
jgi:glutamate-1-semialdehyde 2,1-aminomutase